MSKKRITDKEVNQLVNDAPDVVKELRALNKPIHIDQLFQGADASVRDSITSRGVATMITKGGESDISVVADNEGYVWALAATVPRRPGKSEDYLKGVQDYRQETGDRASKIQMWWRIYNTEGIINNAVTKGSSLISSEGNFYVRRARQKKS